jgi:hypothetical protein
VIVITSLRGRPRRREGRSDLSEGAWPADQVERWPIDRLIPYAKSKKEAEPGRPGGECQSLSIFVE